MLEVRIGMEIRVNVPDAELGFVLAQRLRRGADVEVDDGGACSVRIVEGAERGDLVEILFAIEHWLRDERLRQVDVYFDGETHTMVCP